MQGSPQQGCPFHGTVSSDIPQNDSLTNGVHFLRYPRQVNPITICPGLGRADFLCKHGLIALKQGRVLAFDYRNLSGEALWGSLLDGVREYVVGKYDNFVMTLPETEFLSLRDLQCSAMDFYAVLQIALNRIAMEIVAYRDLQEVHHIFSETVAEFLSSPDCVNRLRKILNTEPFCASLQAALDDPNGKYQEEAALMRLTTEGCKKSPNSQLELLQVIQLSGTQLVEGKLHSFYMGPMLDGDRIRHNPHNIIVLTKASVFTSALLGSETTQRIHRLMIAEETQINLPLLVRPPGMHEELFLGNKLFAVPCRMPMSQYFELPAKSSRPTDSLLPAIRTDIKQTPKLSTVSIEGGFQIGEDIFLIDQSEFPKTKITYTFKGKTGVRVIQETPEFYDDMKDLYKLFCSTKVACIYQKVSNLVTGKTDECNTVFVVMRDVEDNLR